ncbi:hypothetical protein [Rhodococcus sp. ACT016]|uniref:hypothetical protein n=1 Tax=Rhodococcus sp. ACT016 TaxID=3134808 RepID=UPI003D2B7662
MSTDVQAGQPSPWRGSEHFASHDWDFDGAESLLEAASRMTAIADELMSAHSAGWWLVGPMSDGRFHARRPSRRQRARTTTVGAENAGGAAPPLRWRARIVDEVPASDRPRLEFGSAAATPWLAVHDGALQQIAGPALDHGVLTELNAQVGPAETAGRRWAAAPARVGPAVDLVAEDSLLRSHAVIDGVLVRTVETLGYRHAADRAASLPDVAAAYRRLARAAAAMHHAGGRLAAVDDGFVVVEYPAP